MTRAELLEALMVERYGPIRRGPTRTPTAADRTQFENEHERAQQRIRRQQLEEDNRGSQPTTAV